MAHLPLEATRSSSTDLSGTSPGKRSWPSTSESSATWKTIWFRKPFDPGENLFFIQYGPHEVWSKVEEKYPQFKQDPAKRVHANGALRLHAVWMSVENLGDSTKAYESIGLVRGTKMMLASVGASAQEIRTGDGAILLLTPDVPGGPVQKFMADRGQAMTGVSIEVEDLERTRAVLKERLHQEFAVYSGAFGKSVLVPGHLAAGGWIEFFQNGKQPRVERESRHCFSVADLTRAFRRSGPLGIPDSSVRFSSSSLALTTGDKSQNTQDPNRRHFTGKLQPVGLKRSAAVVV